MVVMVVQIMNIFNTIDLITWNGYDDKFLIWEAWESCKHRVSHHMGQAGNAMSSVA